VTVAEKFHAVGLKEIARIDVRLMDKKKDSGQLA
jgi:hypothetical protein